MKPDRAPTLGLPRRVSTLEALKLMVRASDLIDPKILAEMNNPSAHNQVLSVVEALPAEREVTAIQPSEESTS